MNRIHFDECTRSGMNCYERLEVFSDLERCEIVRHLPEIERLLPPIKPANLPTIAAASITSPRLIEPDGTIPKINLEVEVGFEDLPVATLFFGPGSLEGRQESVEPGSEVFWIARSTTPFKSSRSPRSNTRKIRLTASSRQYLQFQRVLGYIGERIRFRRITKNGAKIGQDSRTLVHAIVLKKDVGRLRDRAQDIRTREDVGDMTGDSFPSRFIIIETKSLLLARLW